MINYRALEQGRYKQIDRIPNEKCEAIRGYFIIFADMYLYDYIYL